MKLSRWLSVPLLLLALPILMAPSPPMRPGSVFSIVALLIALVLVATSFFVLRRTKVLRYIPILFAGLAILLLIWDVSTALDPYKDYRGTLGKMRLAAQGRQLDWAAQAGGYPGDLPVKTEKEYIEYLIKNDFLSEQSFRLLSSPGYPAARTLSELSSRNISFTIHRISKSDPPGTVFLTSKPGALKKGTIEIYKGGDQVPSAKISTPNSGSGVLETSPSPTP